MLNGALNFNCTVRFDLLLNLAAIARGRSMP